MKVCTLFGCLAPMTYNQLCGKHNARLERHGDFRPRRYFTFSDSAVKNSVWDANGCRVWTAHLGVGGYGKYTTGGKRVNGVQRFQTVWYVHRLAYILAHGPVASNLDIDHICHNRACFNVEHLRAVTRSQNIQHQKGLSALNTSGCHNVYWSKEKSLWVVQFTHDKGKILFRKYVRDFSIACDLANEMRPKLYTHCKENS